MPATYANMGLKSWNAGADLFSFSELDANWHAIADHDHTTGKGVKIPAGGLANNSVTGAAIASGSITTDKIGAGEVNTANINSGAVDDTKYANQNNSVWRTLLQSNASCKGGSTAGSYYAVAGIGTLQKSGTTGETGLVGIMPQAADYAVAGKTARLRLNVAYSVNGYAPGATITYGLYPVTGSGVTVTGSSYNDYQLGTVVAGSTVAIGSPAAQAIGQGSSSGFDLSSLLSNVQYTIGATLGGTTAGVCYIVSSVCLQMRHT